MNRAERRRAERAAAKNPQLCASRYEANRASRRQFLREAPHEGARLTRRIVFGRWHRNHTRNHSPSKYTSHETFATRAMRSAADLWLRQHG